MASNQISPRWALGLCDICGFSFRLNELKAVIFDQRPTGTKACQVCWDKDNPQLQLGRFTAGLTDPQSLINPRPDTGLQGSTTYFGWMPIGSPLVSITCSVGNLTVLIV